MPVVLEDVKAAAATLTVREQFDLIEYLEVAAFEELDAIRHAWKAESRRRFAQLESGQVQGIPLEDVFPHRKSQ